MGSRFDQYRIKVGDDLGDPDFWNNPRFRDIDIRLNSLESQKTQLDDVIEEGRVVFRERVDEVLAPLVVEIDEIANVGVMLRAHSHTDVQISTGSKILFIDDAERHRFAAPAYVSIMGDGDPSKVMIGAVTAYDRESGQLTVSVSKVAGSGIHDQWVVTVAAATESETAANDAMAARDAAKGYRDQAQISASSIASVNLSAATSATQAVAANSQAQVAKAEAVAARNETVSAISTWISAILPPSDIDPDLRPGGSALQVGDQYFRNTDDKWRTWDGAQWTINAIPLDSTTVSTVFGRTGAIGAQSGDYRGDQIARTSGQQTTLAGATVEAALLSLLSLIDNGSDTKLDVSATSQFVRDNLLAVANAVAARAALELGSIATQDASNVAITGGSITGATFDDGTF